MLPRHGPRNRVQEIQLICKMQFDPLSDAFVRIYNVEQAGHYEVSIAPASNLLEHVGHHAVLGYVGEFERIADGRGVLSESSWLAPSTGAASSNQDTR